MNRSFHIPTANLSKAVPNHTPDIAIASYPRSCRAGLVRRVLCTCCALALLYVYPMIRQASLNRSLAHAIIADQDLEAMRLLDQGADARTLYYPSSDSPWWKQALAMIPDRRKPNEQGRSLLSLMLDRQRTNDAEFLPPTRSHVALMEMLVAKGCAANIRDRWGRTPLEFAIDNDRYQFAACLLDHGADINMPDSAGISLLDRTLRQSDRRLLLLLLEHGADTANHKDPQHRPLDWWTRDFGVAEYVEILRDLNATTR
jgi:ankyrin repeat protein